MVKIVYARLVRRYTKNSVKSVKYLLTDDCDKQEGHGAL